VDGGMLWRNGCDEKVLRCGAGNRHQQPALHIHSTLYYAHCNRAGHAHGGVKHAHINQSPCFKGGLRGPWDLRRRTEIMPVKDSHTRIKPLALASGHGRCMAVTPERTLVSVGEWPLHVAVINL
jgi:hypothetical protein